MSESNQKPPQRLRSEIWFNDRAEPGETAIYIERFGNYGITRQELQSARPVIGIAQTGGDLPLAIEST
jgi:dihydroxy-acid dehydratase